MLFQLISVGNFSARDLDLGVQEAGQQVTNTLKYQWHVLGRHQDLDSKPLIDCVCRIIESFELERIFKGHLFKASCYEQECLRLGKVT